MLTMYKTKQQRCKLYGNIYNCVFSEWTLCCRYSKIYLVKIITAFYYLSMTIYFHYNFIFNQSFHIIFYPAKSLFRKVFNFHY